MVGVFIRGFVFLFVDIFSPLLNHALWYPLGYWDFAYRMKSFEKSHGIGGYSFRGSFILRVIARRWSSAEAIFSYARRVSSLHRARRWRQAILTLCIILLPKIPLSGILHPNELFREKDEQTGSIYSCIRVFFIRGRLFSSP